jgi:hypothetical protein
MIGFVPDDVPDGGYPIDYKLPFARVPGWVQDAGQTFALDRAFGAIAIPTGQPTALPPPVARGGRGRRGGQPPASVSLRANYTSTFAVRGTVRSENLAALLASLSVRLTAFAGLFSDPALVYDADDELCPRPPIGSYENVLTETGTAPSDDVLLAIVDLGFDKNMVRQSAPQTKFEPDLSYKATNGIGAPGTAPGDEHGNMCAYDATLIATGATLADLRVADPKEARLSDAEEAYNFFYARLTENDTYKNRYSGFVLSNSWGLQSKDDNLPPGSAHRYFDNPNHPFTLMVKKLIAERVDVVFSAGDSGGCPAASEDGSIWGANSLDAVVSVAAVDVEKTRLGYSSQGPGALAGNKPDVSSYAEFTGSDDGDRDTGTSAAAAITAGVVTAIRSQNGWGWRNKTPADVKERLKTTSEKDVTQGGTTTTLSGWSRDFGFGIARVP